MVNKGGCHLKINTLLVQIADKVCSESAKDSDAIALKDVGGTRMSVQMRMVVNWRPESRSAVSQDEFSSE